MNVVKEDNNEEVRNLKNNKGKEVDNGDGFTEVKYKKVMGNIDGEGTSKSQVGNYQSNNMKNNGKNGNWRRGIFSKGNNGSRGGNGKGQNWNWSNKGVSHWNLEKNRNYEKFVNGKDDIGNRGLKENNKQQVVVGKDNKKEMGNVSIGSENKTGEGLSNKNSFGILGEIEEEVLDKMEEDDKIMKTVANQNVDSEEGEMGSNESKNNKLMSSIKGEGKKKGNESNKVNKDKLEADNNSSKLGSSQAFEEVNARNSVFSQ